MFIRKQTVNGVDYYRVIESYRENGNVRTRTVVSLGQCATLDEAIAVERRNVEFWEEKVEYGVKRNRRGRTVCAVYLNGREAGLTTVLVGESARPRLVKSRALLAKLEACRDVMQKRETSYATL